MTVHQFYRYYIDQLQQIYTLSEASTISEWVFENKAAIKKQDIIKFPGLVPEKEKLTVLNKALDELLQHRPVQYVLGETWFYQLKLAVNEHVLIPRPETEELVQWIINDHKNENSSFSILDIGTGSGCIAIALKKNLPLATVTAFDISNYPLTLARENAISNKADINYLQLDFLESSTWSQLQAFDIIVSNPPYIPENEKEKLDKNVTAFEPNGALFVPNNSPLLFYENIAAFSATHLNKNGKLYVEVHEDYAKETAAVFDSVFCNVEIRKDMFEKDRMVKATHFR